MTMADLTLTAPAHATEIAAVRAAARGAGTAACIALLAFAAELALETLPAGLEREDGYRALDLAARLAAGEAIDTDLIVKALLYEDKGLMIHHQSAPEGQQAEAWSAVEGALGYAAGHGAIHQGKHPNSLVEGVEDADALDTITGVFLNVPDLNWAALARAAAYVRANGSKAAEGWGRSLRVADLRRAAGRSAVPAAAVSAG